MSLKSKHFHRIPIDIFPVSFYIAKSEKRFLKNIGRNPSFLENSDGMTASHNGRIIVWYRSKKPKIGIIAHETMHAVLRMCEYIGHPITPPDEFSAYLMEYLIENQMDYFREHASEMKHCEDFNHEK